MNRPRRVVRKLSGHPTGSALDEQLWPVQIALVVLAGFLAGIVLSACSFDDPRWYRHPLTWFTAIAALVALLMWVVRHVHPQVVRRAVMLSLVLSLIINAALLFGMAWARIFAAPWLDQQQLTTAETPTRPIILPGYAMAPLQHRNPAQQDFERPVETGSATAENVAVTRQEISDVPRDESTQSTHIDDASQQQQTHLRSQRRTVNAPPRRGESLSLLSRQIVIQAGKPWSHQARPMSAPSPRRQVDTLAPSAPQSSSPQSDLEQVLPASTSELTRQPAVALELQRRALPADRLTARPLEQLAMRSRPRSDAVLAAMLEQNQPQRLPTRSRKAAELATSRSAISRPAVATSDNSTPDPSAEPARTVLSHAKLGIAGIGRSPNLERGANTASSHADLASTYAQRADDSQAMPAGLALAPSLPVRQRSTRSGGQSFTTSVRVQQVAIGNIRGSESPAEATVSAATTLERASANAEQANLTAAKGDTQIDLGPRRVVGRQSSGRASGGGQPELNLRTQSRLVSRSRVGGAERISLQADVAAEVAAPAADGSQQPPSLEAHPDASSLVRTTQGGATAVSLEAASDRTVAMPAIASISVTGATQASRAEPIEAPQALSKSGGGLERRKVAAPPVFAANTTAQTVSVAGSDKSAGRENAAAVTATGIEISRTSAVFERDADVGPGGATQALANVVGFATPRAQRHSKLLQIEDARFIRRSVGGPPVTSSRAAVAVDAFRHRLKRRGVDQPGGGRPAPPRTEEAIELGLVYLSRHQQADGRWRLSNSVSAGEQDPTPTLSSDTAATGLSLLAFLGAGYHHLDDKYQGSVREALGYLLEIQADDGNLYVRDDEFSGASVALYSHGIAALALCEAYGMTQDPWLREPAQKALSYISATQHPKLGGWRYTPGVESDTSVSGWMLMALKSGELAELDVAPEVYQRAEQWLNGAQASDSERHLYRYNPFAANTEKQRHGRQPTHVMTSVGLLMRMYLGWRRDNPWMQQGADYLAANPPRAGTSGSAWRDTYYWYYATQVMFHMGGQQWEAWNSRLHPLLVDAQIQEGELAGSWNPFAPVPDRWAVHAGRLYVTTMNLLSLEVYYRHLPIYADTAR